MRHRTVGVAPLLVAALAAFTAGCSSAPNPSAPADASVDAVVTDDAATSDANDSDGGLVDYDPNVYPAPHHPLPKFVKHAGPVLQAMKLVVITFTGDARRDDLRAFDQALVSGSAWWTSVAQGYGVGPAASVSFLETADPFGSRTVDTVAEVTPWVQGLVDAGKVPTPDASTVYAIYFGANTPIKTPSGSSCTDLAADHESAVLRVGDAGTVEVGMAYMPICDGVDIHEASSHELIETATDPYPITHPAYTMDNIAWSIVGPLEVGDICYFWAPFTTFMGHPAARSWNDVAAAAGHDPCQPAISGHLFYGASVETQRLAPGSSTVSDGYIVAKRGTTAVFDGVFFSEGPLPNDARLFVGNPDVVPSGAGFDAYSMAPVGTGILTHLSLTKAHNGQRFKLSVTVPMSTPAVRYSVIMRAVVAADDYQQWPLDLLVK